MDDLIVQLSIFDSPTLESDNRDQSPGNKLLPEKVVVKKTEKELFYLPIEEEPTKLNLTSKIDDNISAINLLLIKNNYEIYSKNDKKTLAKFNGFGGTDFFYNKKYANYVSDLEIAYGKEIVKSGHDTKLSAYYTPPNIISGIYDYLIKQGFKGGNILEPSAGAGRFIGLMPKDIRENSHIFAVEKDKLTCDILKRIYSSENTTVINNGFEDVQFPPKSFDLIIGNPPYGDYKVYDNKYTNESAEYIHNYFILKSSKLLKSNGLLIQVLPQGFLDSKRNSTRKALSNDGIDILGAIRLPSVFDTTSICTDIVIMQKTNNKEIANYVDSKADYPDLLFNLSPEDTALLAEKGKYINPIFSDKNIFNGTSANVIQGQFDTLEFSPTTNNNENLFTQLSEKSNIDIGDLPNGKLSNLESINTAEIKNDDFAGLFKGELFIYKEDIYVSMGSRTTFDGETSHYICRWSPENLSIPKIAILKQYLEIKTKLVNLYDLEVSTVADNSNNLDQSRKDLNDAYDAFVAKYGQFNKQFNKNVISIDAVFFKVLSLEIKNKNGDFQKADIFNTRVVFYKPLQTKVNTADEALIFSLTNHCNVDIDYMVGLLDETPYTRGTLVKELIAGNKIFPNPTTKKYETAEEYLSGDVKTKLSEAEYAVNNEKNGEPYRKNVEALKKVIPSFIDEPSVSLGGSWIPVELYEQFITHISTNNSSRKATVVYISALNLWETRGFKDINSDEYQTGECRFSTIFLSAMNGQPIKISRTDIDGKQIPMWEESLIANNLVTKLKNEFKKWVFDDLIRGSGIALIYNEKFNRTVVKNYDGNFISTPDKVSDDKVTLRPHQKNAIWRILNSPSTLLDHSVGAGKTFTMIASAIEMKRIGLVNKSLVIVPIAILNQFANDIPLLYPRASFLVATDKDFQKKNRQKFLSQMKSNNWDIIVMTHSSFGLIPLSDEILSKELNIIKSMYDQEIYSMKDAISTTSMNQLLKKSANLVAQIDKLSNMKRSELDATITFDELGVDAFFVDEAQNFKNLAFHTSNNTVKGMGNPAGSKKALDLYLKIKHLKEHNINSKIIFSTGTPISNSIVELYTMQKYLDNAYLEQSGLMHFDQWASMFANVVTRFEINATQKYVPTCRLNEFNNLPELKNLYTKFADIFHDKSSLEIPPLKNNKITFCLSPITNDQAIYIDSLQDRVENLTGDLSIDNMLKIISDAKKAATDMRLIDSDIYADTKNPKIDSLVKNVYAKYLEFNDDKGTQLVFSDIGIPKNANSDLTAEVNILIEKAKDNDASAIRALEEYGVEKINQILHSNGFSVYEEVKLLLMKSGIPSSQIAFIHDPKTKDAKEMMLERVRTGDIRVLIGSRPKMGAGMNVQNLLVANHHLDIPWRPSDLEQADGRIIRQGNELLKKIPNFAIEIFRYSTKETLDAMLWQIIESKAKAIEVMRNSSNTIRTLKVADESINAGEMKALTSGNPDIMEEVELNNKIKERRIEIDYFLRSHRMNNILIESNDKNISNAETRIESLKLDLAVATDIENNKTPFSITHNKNVYYKPADLEKYLSSRAKTCGRHFEPLGVFSGFSLSIMRTAILNQFEFNINNNGGQSFSIAPNVFSAKGLITRLKNKVSPKGILASIDKSELSLKELKSDGFKLSSLIKSSSEKESRAKLHDLEKQLEVVQLRILNKDKDKNKNKENPVVPKKVPKSKNTKKTRIK